MITYPASVSVRYIFFAASLICFSADAADLDDMKFDELQLACRKLVEGYRTATPIVEDARILAWYRIKDKRPWHLDHALCWGHAWIDFRHRWALGHLVRNPSPRSSGRTAEIESTWKPYKGSAHSRSSILRFQIPPTNEDVQKLNTFEFSVNAHWEMYASDINEREWIEVIGALPTQTFSRIRKDAP
jgi:hypothetical protein